MPVNRYTERASFGLLPEPEGRSASFITSAVINLILLAVVLIIGMTARHAIEEHRYEQMVLIVPNTPPPPPKPKMPEAPKLREPPKMPEVKLEAPKINIPRPEPKPDLKPIQLEAKVKVPVFKLVSPKVIVAPQPKQALAAAAMPAQDNRVKPSTAPVHLGQTFGVTPNPNATRPATIAAIGNPYGGMQGPSIAPHGVVGSTGIGDGLKFGANGGKAGRVASVAIPASAVAAPSGNGGRVAAAGIPAMVTVAAAPKMVAVAAFTNLEVISKPPVRYTTEAKQYKVQGDVILRVTFTASGQVVVQNVLHGLGHGLDEEARRVAQQIRFRPATRNGQAVDMTTNIVITFQLA